MSKKIRTETPSVLPYFAFGAVWLLGGILFPLYRLGWLLAVLALSVAAFAAAKRVCPPHVTEYEAAFHTGLDDVDDMLKEIDTQLARLHAINQAIPDAHLTDCMSRMEKAGRSIVETVDAHPEKAKQIRRFANYYLPDAVRVLQQYATLARQGVRGENAAAVKNQVETSAATIATAFENQLDSLYAAESMDISADIEVLQSLLKGQGLS